MSFFYFRYILAPRITRKVRKDSTITIDSVCYDVPMQFISAKVDIRYLPDDMTSAYILVDGKKFPIRRTNRNDNCHTRRNNLPPIDYAKAGGDAWCITPTTGFPSTLLTNSSVPSSVYPIKAIRSVCSKPSRNRSPICTKKKDSPCSWPLMKPSTWAPGSWMISRCSWTMVMIPSITLLIHNETSKCSKFLSPIKRSVVKIYLLSLWV